MRGWSRQLPGVPIIGIDYSLSPQNPFPSALQEILDTYLWLISDTPPRDGPSAKDILGFQPRRIIICGDSAGGNLTMTCTMAIDMINEVIRKKKSQQNSSTTGSETIPLPHSLVCFYPSFLMTPSLSPSRIYGAVDFILGSILCLNISRLYIHGHDYANPEKIKDSQIFCDPLVSPLCASHDVFERLSSVKLWLIGSNFDPLADDSTAMANRWKGKSTTY